MTEVNDLLRLLELQEADSEQAALERELAALNEAPELAAARQQVGAREATRKEYREQLARLAREVSWAEQEVADFKRRQEQLEHKLYSGEVASPKELDQMRKKMELLKRDAGSLEDRILKTMEDMDALRPLEAEETRALEADQALLREAEERNATRRAEVEEALRGMPARRQALAGAIDPALLAEYERIRVRRGGVAAVKLVKGICGGCRVAVPPVLLGQARQGRPVKCESCGRLLCWVEG